MKNINESIAFVNEHDDLNILIRKFANKEKKVALCLDKKKKSFRYSYNWRFETINLKE